MAKVERYINNHLQAAVHVDSGGDVASIESLIPAMGLSTDEDDRDMAREDTEIVRITDTPCEILRVHAPDLPIFHREPEEVMIEHSNHIRRVSSHETLRKMFIDNPSDFQWAMESPDECRSHSIYLSAVMLATKAMRARDARVTQWEICIYRTPVGKVNRKRVYHRVNWTEVPKNVHEALRDTGYIPRRDMIYSAEKVPMEDDAGGIVREYKYNEKARHALHMYACGFTDFFFQCVTRMRFSDADVTSQMAKWSSVSLLDLYGPLSTRAFHAGDLPNLSCLLGQISLNGKQTIKSKIPIVKTIIKAFPMCCQSRHLIKTIITNCMTTEGYWRVIRDIFYCSLAGTYPSATKRPGQRALLRIHYLCHDKEAFVQSLGKEERDNEKRAAQGLEGQSRMCQLVFVVFREFFIYLVERTPSYIEVIKQVITDWDDFVFNTRYMADEMRAYGRLEDAPNDDAFYYTLSVLEVAKSGCKTKVQRFVKHTFPVQMEKTLSTIYDDVAVNRIAENADITALEQCKATMTREAAMELETIRTVRDIFKGNPVGVFETDKPTFLDMIDQALQEAKEVARGYNYTMLHQVKIAILDYAMRITPDEYTRFEALMNPELGGISRDAVATMQKAQNIYETNFSPKAVKTQVENISVHDLWVMTWYISLIVRLSRISFIDLDVDTVNEIDEAIRRNRFLLHPSEELPSSAYDVYVTICCERVASFHDIEMYGALDISYDVETNSICCSKKMTRAARARPKRAKKTSTAHAEYLKKARAERNAASFIPCGQPVVPINLYGRALVYKGVRYQHCGKCGVLHKYKDEWWGKNGYMCGQCRSKDPVTHDTAVCAVCGECNRGQPIKEVPVQLDRIDPLNPEHTAFADSLSCYQTMYMCQKHANSAGLFGKHPSKRVYLHVPKDELWDIIVKETAARIIRNKSKYG
jgi:hypothetical protein